MKPSKDIRIITHSDRVETLLNPFREDIGDDLEGYRGHVYRVLSYALHFLEGDETHRPLVETALVYHDLALWSDRKLAYLEPSGERAKRDNATHGWGYDPQLLYDIIYWHHKMRPFRGPNEKIVNAVRKADWIDATRGIFKMGMPKACIRQVTEAIPNAGFHKTLMRLGPELSSNIIRMFGDFSKVYKF